MRGRALFLVATVGSEPSTRLGVADPFSVSAVPIPTGGREKVRTRIDVVRLHKVAAFNARVTRHNPVPAKSTDG